MINSNYYGVVSIYPGYNVFAVFGKISEILTLKEVSYCNCHGITIPVHAHTNSIIPIIWLCMVIT